MHWSGLGTLPPTHPLTLTHNQTSTLCIQLGALPPSPTAQEKNMRGPGLNQYMSTYLSYTYTSEYQNCVTVNNEIMIKS